MDEPLRLLSPLSFPDAIETRYRFFYLQRYARQTRLGLSLGSGSLLLVLLIQLWISPDMFEHAVVVRLSTLMIIFLMLFLSFKRSLQRYVPVLALIAVCCAILNVFSVVYVTTGTLRYSAFSAVSLMVLAGTTAIRMPFSFARVFCAVTPVAGIGFLAWLGEPVRMLLSQAMVLGIGCFMALSANWLMEFNSRRHFLQLRLLTIEQRQSRSTNRRLRRLLDRDVLTGIFNRRHFDETLNNEWRRALRNGTHLSVLMIDVDYFKAYNDHYGHQAGDGCLHQLAQTIAECFKRSGETVARYGGEEFVVILPLISLEEAVQRAEVVRQAVQDRGIQHDYSTVAPVVTVSVGVATVTPHTSLNSAQLVTAADQALYAAKHAGRNGVKQADVNVAQSG